MRATLTMLLLLCVLLTIAGCVSDKFVVFEKDVLSEKEMEEFIGQYESTEAKGVLGLLGMGKQTLRIEKKAAKYLFSMKGRWKRITPVRFGAGVEVPKEEDRQENISNIHGSFLLSKIPNSKSGLLLFSCPEIAMTDGDEQGKPRKNFFAIIRSEHGKLYVWLPSAMEKGGIKSKNGVFKAKDVKDFLEKHADAYTKAREPLTFTKAKQPAKALAPK